MTIRDDGAQRRTRAFSNATLMRRLLDALPAMIGYWDRDLRNVIANAAFLEWYGLSPEQLHGRYMHEVLGEYAYAENLPYVQAVLRGETQVYERTLTVEGRTRHIKATYIPDLDAGQVRGFFVLVIDITAQAEAQRTLAAAQRLAELGSYSWDRATGVITWSEEMFRIAGVDPDSFDTTFENYLELVHPEDRAGLRDKVYGAMASGQGYHAQYRLVRPDGEIRYIRSRARPQFAEDGSVERVNGVAQDVTEAERAERELTRVNAELDRANTLQADLIAMLGHEARQPLALVRLLIESVLSSWDELSDEVKLSELTRAAQATYELGHLLDDVLAMTYVESGRAVGNGAPTRVIEAVERCLALEPSDVDVRTEVDERLAVLAEPWQLRQMIGNLITNARKYGAPPIVISARPVGDSVEISVADSGAGVPDAFVPHLFERFARARNTAQHGTGFGLYIVRRLAETNHGTVGYHPNQPTGAIFTITLPAAPSDCGSW